MKPNHPDMPVAPERFLGSYLTWVTASPEAVAIRLVEEELSFRKLHERVVAYAEAIVRSGEMVIGVDADGSMNMNAGIIAVFLLGRTLVPVHPVWPEERKRIALTESGAGVLLAGSDDAPALDGAWKIIAEVDSAAGSAFSFPPFDAAACEVPAYILFTSGSTGIPKGVPVPYRALHSFLAYYTRSEEYAFGPADRFLQTYDASFDVFYFPLLVSLESGACCCLLPLKKQIRSLLILEALQQYRITVVSMVPTVLQVVASLLPKISLPDLRLSFFSGDILFRKLALLWEKTCPGAIIYNCYGPTETTIVCTSICWNRYRDQYNGNIFPLGFPFPGTQVKVVDNGTICSKGEIGELYIGGSQVFNGYLEQENNTLENGYFPSGDLVHADDAGCLHFHGRKDFQVKIGGYRIETEEVAGRIAEALNHEVVVVAQRDDDGNNHLIACVKTTEPLNVAAMAQLLKPLLPPYMIPGRYIAVKDWPYNSNGKIDRRQLTYLINHEEY